MTLWFIIKVSPTNAYNTFKMHSYQFCVRVTMSVSIHSNVLGTYIKTMIFFFFFGKDYCSWSIDNCSLIPATTTHQPINICSINIKYLYNTIFIWVFLFLFIPIN